MKISIEYVDIKSNNDRYKVLGLTVSSGRRVFIQRGLDKQKTFEVLMHELTHAALIHRKIYKSNKEHERLAFKVGRYARRHVFKRRKR